MPRDKLLVPLLEIAQGTALNEDDLARMVGDEISRLSTGARVHDYIQVIAIKCVTDKVRQAASHNRANGNHHAREG
ncbi:MULTISPECIES: DUF3562 domain-containing protein [Paraburkholderia]|uniref:DUF3562 domain-containing protein n=1 Tax=Paraburkholderia madseniana TaxID=2599607 RepID=A0AAP5B8K3_9BURK|nr:MULTISPECIES: DUF3562 domain-containing protein [Paraburkholderia]MCX4145107.1 DUF3562 domain-containing protein [Paraburkholderia madseniana]MDN7148058.1 DUF3562 domain-containing protein [Paraburkholderia sp. WS6]MDQ6406938.1 DUF3562 domain-containing protein [Paraburkholderia madseniana]